MLKLFLCYKESDYIETVFVFLVSNGCVSCGGDGGWGGAPKVWRSQATKLAPFLFRIQTDETRCLGRCKAMRLFTWHNKHCICIPEDLLRTSHMSEEGQ